MYIGIGTAQLLLVLQKATCWVLLIRIASPGRKRNFLQSLGYLAFKIKSVLSIFSVKNLQGKLQSTVDRELQVSLSSIDPLLFPGRPYGWCCAANSVSDKKAQIFNQLC